MYIDSHAHLYLDVFDADRTGVITAAKAEGIEGIYLPNVDCSTIGALHTLADQEKGFCMPMMGLHPCSVKKDFKSQLIQIKEQFATRSYCAVGEIGLDLHWDKTYLDQQKEAFITQCHWAKELDLPIVIHSRESIDLLLEIIEQFDFLLRGVFHCFTGSLTQAKRIMDLGFCMGIGGVVTFKNSKLDSVLTEVPLTHLLLETDAPYLTPHPYRGKRNESKYIPLIAEKLSLIYNRPVDQIANQTSTNARGLFGPG